MTQITPSTALKLLEALRRVVSVADRKTDEFDEARAAIALAEQELETDR